MTSLELRQLTPELLPTVLELDQQCFGGLWTLEGYQRELDSPNSDLLVLIPAAASQDISPEISNPLPQPIRQNNSAKADLDNPSSRLLPPMLGLACLWAIVDEAHITIVAVHPEHQRQGFGQTLLYALLRAAHQRGLERATLEVRISNQSAINLYQKFGFKVAGQRKGYYEETGEDALILWRSGLQHPDFLGTLATWQQEIEARLTQQNWLLTVISDTVDQKTSSLTCA